MRDSRKRGLITAGIIMVIAAMGSAPGVSAQSGCGNFNCSGIVDLADLSQAISYVTNIDGVGSLSCPSIADMDGYYLFNLYDLALLWDVGAHAQWGSGICPPTLPALDPPVSADDYIFFDNQVFPAGTGSTALSVAMVISDTSDWFQFPIRLLVNTQPPTIDSVKTTGPLIRTGSGNLILFQQSTDDPVPSPVLPSRLQQLCKVYLSMPPEPTDRPITLTFDPVGPVQDGHKIGIPMVIRQYPGRAVVTPMIQFCCQGTRGNVNMQGIVDLGDLSYLVSFLTGGGTDLPCADEANVNNEGIVDLADLSALVSYLTGGGYVLPNCG